MENCPGNSKMLISVIPGLLTEALGVEAQARTRVSKGGKHYVLGVHLPTSERERLLTSHALDSFLPHSTPSPWVDAGPEGARPFDSCSG